jgi:hypothetical protein
MEKKVFRSRISVLLIGFLLPTFIPFIPFIKNMIITGLCIMGGYLLFMLLMLTGIQYEITEKKLRVKLLTIPYWSCLISEITSVERSYNVLSSPAASLKRLKVKGHNIFLLISPAKEKEFLDALKQANPDIYIRVPDKKGWWRIWDWDI